MNWQTKQRTVSTSQRLPIAGPMVILRCYGQQHKRLQVKAAFAAWGEIRGCRAGVYADAKAENASNYL